ncbi:ABC transporter permease [Halocatena marina]|nr:ABC transporter permease [Halocatena marina]
MDPPRWFPLARKEARTLLTAKGPWALAVLLVLWGYRPSYAGWDGLGPDITAGFVQIAGSYLLPLGVLLLSYQSIVGERTSGSIKFTLGLPLTRTDVLVGKVLGRSAGITIPVTAAAVVLGLIGLVRFGLFSPLLFLAILLATALYIVVLVAVATAVSAVTSSTVRATGIIVGIVYLVLTIFWKTASGMIYSNLSGRAADTFNTSADGLLFALLRISPGRAYRVLTNWLLGVGNSGAGYDSVIMKLQPRIGVNVYVVEATFEAGAVPLYLHEISGLVVLLLWLIVPLGLARYHFERRDLV